MIIHAPISIGELIDKISILNIKSKRITDYKKRQNVINELIQLEAIQYKLNIPPIDDLYEQLYKVNNELWDIEDAKRKHEKFQDFGPVFIELARNVYLKNDLRAKIKHEINTRVGSTIIEEKSY
jgi:hypothetical protein